MASSQTFIGHSIATALLLCIRFKGVRPQSLKPTKENVESVGITTNEALLGNSNPVGTHLQRLRGR